MKVVTADEMKRIDRGAIEEHGIPGVTLMENAGRHAALSMIDFYGNLTGKKIVVIAGKGNNGGDGFVLARHLYNADVKAVVYLLGDSNDMRGDAKTNLDLLKKSAVPFYENITLKDLERDLRDADIIVDAIFGTGLSSDVTEPYSDIINAINSSGKPVVSVDIPSGISGDTGEILGAAVKANFTVTFALPKRGLLVFPGAEHAGVLKIVDIGIPEKVIEKEDIKCNILTKEEINALLPKRRPDSYKTSFGHLLVIAGSVGKTGAAAMTSLSALRTGAGLVTLATPASLNYILELKLTEVMTVPLPETDELSLSTNAEHILKLVLQDMTTIAIGPGLSTHPETSELVRNLLGIIQQPMVIDADGINALVGYLDVLKEAKAPLVLTPHPGEMARLLGKTSEEIQSDRINIAQRFAIEYQICLVLKGARTIVSDPNGNVFINPTGNPGMATAGTGDVLTGMIGGLIAQGIRPFDAAAVGVYLHGLAGDQTAEKLGEMGMIASDIIDRIPKAIMSLKSDGTGIHNTG